MATERSEGGKKEEGGKITKHQHNSLIIAEGKGEPL
jgi:hypothetical protein